MGAKSKEETPRNICGVLIAKMTSAEEARKTAKAMRGCPYVIATGISGSRFCNILVVPESKRWWLQYTQKRPDIMGAKKVNLVLIDELLAPEGFEPKVVDKKLAVAPCGADCLDCPLREQFDCRGCPATTRYV